MSKTILTIFAGRKASLQILKKYLDVLLSKGLLDEVHLWNYVRNTDDTDYIQSITNIRRAGSSDCGTYFPANLPVVNNGFSFQISRSTRNNIHIRLTDKDMGRSFEIILYCNYEICNMIVKKNDIIIFERQMEEREVRDERSQGYDKKTTYSVQIIDHVLHVFENNQKLLIQVELTPWLPPNGTFQIGAVHFKTGFLSTGWFEYETTNNHHYYLMDTCIKRPWTDYYQHYADPQYKDDVIVKCDDDIVFIDVDRFAEFVSYVKTSPYNCIFANIINNGVCAHIQQNHLGLIPKSLMELEYPEGGFCGSLWESGKKATHLHNYFIDHLDRFLSSSFTDKEKALPVTTRVSINFFGFRGRDWHKITGCGDDDEKALTVDYVRSGLLQNAIYLDLFVSHLSFYKQEETHFERIDTLDKYHCLAETWLPTKTY